MSLSIREGGRLVTRALALAVALALAGCGGDGGTNPPPPAESTPPTARFLVLPPYGVIGTEFVFDASRSIDAEDSLGVLEVRWDWYGDGAWDTEFSAAKTALRRFDEDGTFAVLLQVRDTSGLTDTTRSWVHLFHPTECTASAEPMSGTAPLAVDFDALATGGHGVFFFRWAFADGDSSLDEGPLHIFETPGSYDVVLRVIDPVFFQPDCFDTIRVEVAADPAAAAP